jgi:hypothetical protein
MLIFLSWIGIPAIHEKSIFMVKSKKDAFRVLVILNKAHFEHFTTSVSMEQNPS